MISFVFKLVVLNLVFISSSFVLLPSYPIWFGLLAVVLIMMFVGVYKQFAYEQTNLARAITEGLRSLQDGDFAVSLVEPKNAQNRQVVQLFNQVTDKLRAQKQSVFQRELLLDKVVNASDVITVLVNHRQTIVFANLAAKKQFQYESMLGSQWETLIEEHAPQLKPHLSQNNAIIQLETLGNAGNEIAGEQSWHLSRHQVKLHGAVHQLILLKPLTKELHRQELVTWKKVIRVINHELNNSIAPISSMCHSGKLLAERLEQPQLDKVFNTISGRIKKLSVFIQDYSQLARLSNAVRADFELLETVQQLSNLYQFDINNQLEKTVINADCSQIEQLLINLLKNANQACPDKNCQLTLTSRDQELVIIVRDFGPGMKSEVMEKAFLPYYTTKVDGSGIGLSICREVVDAHNGQIEVNNHLEGGLQVIVRLPIG